MGGWRNGGAGGGGGSGGGGGAGTGVFRVNLLTRVFGGLLGYNPATPEGSQGVRIMIFATVGMYGGAEEMARGEMLAYSAEVCRLLWGWCVSGTEIPGIGFEVKVGGRSGQEVCGTGSATVGRCFRDWTRPMPSYQQAETPEGSALNSLEPETGPSLGASSSISNE